MNENAQKLVAALRSGEFEQGHGQLRDGDKFCCLGVACELYRRENGGEWDDETFLGAWLTLPEEVQTWIGFSTEEGAASFGDVTSLANLNDSGSSFQDIADAIESESEGLFSVPTRQGA